MEIVDKRLLTVFKKENFSITAFEAVKNVFLFAFISSFLSLLSLE